MADPDWLRKKGRPSTTPIGSTAVPPAGTRHPEPSNIDQVLDRQQTAGNTAVNDELLNRSRSSEFTSEEIQESIAEDTSTEPTTQAPSLVRKGELGTRKSPGKSVPSSLESGNFSHKYAEPLRKVLPPPEIDERFTPDLEKGNIIPLSELPDGLLAEQPIGSIFRADRVTRIFDAENRIIYEIKPDTVQSIRNGQNQVLRSVELANRMGRDQRRDWRGIVVVYNRKAARKFVAPPGTTPKPGRGPRGGGSAKKASTKSSGTIPAEGENVSSTGQARPAKPAQKDLPGGRASAAIEETVAPIEPSPLETGHYDVLPSGKAPPKPPPTSAPQTAEAAQAANAPQASGLSTSSTRPPAAGETTSTKPPASGETTRTPEPVPSETSTTGPGPVKPDFGNWAGGGAVAPAAQGAGTYINELGIQAQQNEELQKAAEAVARLEQEKQEALNQGKWVITVVVFDYRINIFEHVFREPEDVKRFQQAYLKIGNTYDEARYGTRAEREAKGPLLLAGRPSFPPSPPLQRSTRYYAHALWDVAAPPRRLSDPKAKSAADLFGRWHPAGREEITLQVLPRQDGIHVESWHPSGSYRVTVAAWQAGAPVLGVVFTDDRVPGWRRTSRFEVVTPRTMIETFELRDPAAPNRTQTLGFQLWVNSIWRRDPMGGF